MSYMRFCDGRGKNGQNTTYSIIMIFHDEYCGIVYHFNCLVQAVPVIPNFTHSDNFSKRVVQKCTFLLF